MNSLSFAFSRLPRVLAALIAWALGTSTLSAKTELPSGGTIATSYHAGQNISFWQGAFNGEPVGSMEEVSSDHPDFDTAIRITVTNPSGNFWTGGGRFPIATAASQGDVGIVRLFFRTIQTLAETGAAVSTIFVQGPANEKSIVREITSDNEWKEYLIPFSFIESYNLGESEDSDTLREKTIELFNSGGPFNHLKWKAWAGDWGGTQWAHQNATPQLFPISKFA